MLAGDYGRRRMCLDFTSPTSSSKSDHLCTVNVNQSDPPRQQLERPTKLLTPHTLVAGWLAVWQKFRLAASTRTVMGAESAPGTDANGRRHSAKPIYRPSSSGKADGCPWSGYLTAGWWPQVADDDTDQIRDTMFGTA